MRKYMALEIIKPNKTILEYNEPIILDKDENIYLIDSKNYKIRKASKKK